MEGKASTITAPRETRPGVSTRPGFETDQTVADAPGQLGCFWFACSDHDGGARRAK
jgi:hypothetical protein